MNRIIAEYERFCAYDAKCGRAFLKGLFAVAEKHIAFDADKDIWITVYPHGKEHKGQPIRLNGDGTILAGAGEKNGRNIKDLSDKDGTAKADKALQDTIDIAASYGHSYRSALALGAADFRDWLFTDDGFLASCPKLRELGLKLVDELRQNAQHIDLDQLEVLNDSKHLRDYMCGMLAQNILQHIESQRGLRSNESQVLENIKDTVDELQENLGKSMGLSLKATISRLEGLAAQRELGGSKPPVYKPKGLVGAGECTPMSFKDSELYDVNPHYNKTEGYNNNCQACVVACEMRCRGLDVEALPAYGLKNRWLVSLSNRPQDIWWDSATKAPPDPITIGSLADLEKLVQNEQRFALSLRWKDESGHIVTVTRQNRQLIIFDPQSGTKLGLAQFFTSRIKDASLEVFRIDNCLILPSFAEHVLIKAKQATIMD